MYQIVFWKGKAQIGSFEWRHNLQSAKDHVRQFLRVHGATLAEVIDSDTLNVDFSYKNDDLAGRRTDNDR